MPGLAANSIIESELWQHSLEVVDVKFRGEPLTTPGAMCSFVVRARCLIQLHANLGRALKDVEELSEGQKQKRANHGDGMQNRQEPVK